MKALLIVDMQNAWFPLCHDKTILERIIRLRDKARDRNALVVYVADVHSDLNDKEFARWKPHCMRGSEEAKIVADLAPRPGEPVIEKQRYSGFYNTTLDSILKSHLVSELFVVGVFTDRCVQLTAADAYNRNYDVLVVKDCVAATKQEYHDAALKWMSHLCAKTVSLQEALMMF